MPSHPASKRRFDVALSFPGEHRDFVEGVAGHLAATFGRQRVLYDKYHEEEFARLDLNTYLPALYRKDSDLVVIFLCPQYAAKLWCRLEWRHISQLIATVEAKRIMFLSFGNPGDLSDLGILSGDGYLNLLELTAQTVAQKIVKRFRINNEMETRDDADDSGEKKTDDKTDGHRPTPTLNEVLPGAWQVQIWQPTGFVEQMRQELFPNGTFRGEEMTPMGLRVVEGQWQVNQLTQQVIMQGRQTCGFQMAPFAVMVQVTQFDWQQVVAMTNVGERVAWQRIGPPPQAKMV